MLDHEHSTTTRTHHYRYLFTQKHHGGDKSAAQWLPTLSEDEEFTVFDDADALDFSDDDGNLFGALSDGEESLRIIGTSGEQMAKFWSPSHGSPWHGHPIEWLNDQRRRPGKEVFNKMVANGRIDHLMLRRLMKGDHV